MQCYRRYCLLCTATLASISLAISIGQHLGARTGALPALEDGNIPALTDYLNRTGLKIQLCSSWKNGVVTRNAFLTTAHKDWEELNGSPYSAVSV